MMAAMGAVALARQTFYDAQWYTEAWRAFARDGSAARPATNMALDTLAGELERDALFILDAPDEQYALRADRFAREFGRVRAAMLSHSQYEKQARIS